MDSGSLTQQRDVLTTKYFREGCEVVNHAMYISKSPPDG